MLLDSDGNYDRSIQYLDTYAFTTQGVVFGNEEQRRLYPSRTPNPDITWERDTTYDIGLDLRFLNDRLSIEADYFYHKRTCRTFLNKYDKEFLKNKSKIKNVHEFLEKANDEITDFVKDQTNDLLDKTLFTASCEMKNGFSRSDA